MFDKSAEFYDAVYSFKDYAAEARAIRQIVRRRRPDARSLLDVACGTGKHIELLKPGFEEVEGLDLDPELLAIAKDRNPDCTFHLGDMTEFDLGRRFDVVTCLFSSIGYMVTTDRLGAAVRAMARHLEPSGVLIVEPWFGPEDWEVDRLHALMVDEPDIKIVRMNLSGRIGDVSVMDFHYLVGTREGFFNFSEHHELGLFTHQQYLDAFEGAGLSATHDPIGLMGRGLYVLDAAID